MNNIEFIDQSQGTSPAVVIQYKNGQINISPITPEAVNWNDKQFQDFIIDLFKQQNYFPEKVAFSFAILAKEL